MSRGATVEEVLAQAEQHMRIWEANPDFKLGTLTKEELQTMIDDLRQEKGRMENLRTQLTAQVNTVNDKADSLHKLNVRLRGGYKATYGPNSSQYEQAGGKREQERKRPSSKKKTDKNS